MNNGSLERLTFPADDGGDLAVLSPAHKNARLAALATLSQEISRAECSTFDMANVSQQTQRVIVECAEQVILWDHAPTTINLKHILCRHAEQFDKGTGEMVSTVRTLLIDADGMVFSTGSPVVARTAFALMQMDACLGGFDPPIKVTIGKIPTMSGGKCLTMTVDQDDLAKIVD